MVKTHAARLPGPPELLPGLPDAVIDLQTDEGVGLVGGTWRYADTRVTRSISSTSAMTSGRRARANRTYDVVPHAEPADFDDSALAGPGAGGHHAATRPTAGCASTGTAST